MTCFSIYGYTLVTNQPSCLYDIYIYIYIHTYIYIYIYYLFSNMLILVHHTVCICSIYIYIYVYLFIYIFIYIHMRVCQPSMMCFSGMNIHCNNLCWVSPTRYYAFDRHFYILRCLNTYIQVSINMGTPIAGWFIRENPIQMDDDWGYPYFRKPSYMYLYNPLHSNPSAVGIFFYLYVHMVVMMKLLQHMVHYTTIKTKKTYLEYGLLH